LRARLRQTATHRWVADAGAPTAPTPHITITTPAATATLRMTSLCATSIVLPHDLK
jgi:hypothetical protein